MMIFHLLTAARRGPAVEFLAQALIVCRFRHTSPTHHRSRIVPAQAAPSLRSDDNRFRRLFETHVLALREADVAEHPLVFSEGVGISARSRAEHNDAE